MCNNVIYNGEYELQLNDGKENRPASVGLGAGVGEDVGGTENAAGLTKAINNVAHKDLGHGGATSQAHGRRAREPGRVNLAGVVDAVGRRRPRLQGHLLEPHGISFIAASIGIFSAVII